MANWRKQQTHSHHHQQVGAHWRSSSFSRKPPLDNFHSSVPSWEKKFCFSVGSVPWRKLIEAKKYMSIHHNVLNWKDSAVKEAFDNAKSRYWAEINGLPCDISLPDPNIYIDEVDWDSSIDPELLLDLEREPKEEKNKEQVVILGTSFLTNQEFSCTGWGDAEVETLKPSDPTYAAQGWDSNLPENTGGNSWEQYYAPAEQAKEYEWQNDSRGWNQRKQYDGNGNWGTWDSYDRKRENMSRNKNYAYNNGNEYQMNRGRRNNRGGRRHNFGYDRSYVDKVPTPTAW